MAGETNITIVGNLVADPELRFTPAGAAVANFRVASTPRRWDANAGQMVDGDPVFLTCNAWRGLAENVAESIQKGMRVVVSGVLKQRSFETREGEKRTVFEVDVEDVGPSLKWATARVARNERSGGASGGFGGAGGHNSPHGASGGAGGAAGYADGGFPSGAPAGNVAPGGYGAPNGPSGAPGGGYPAGGGFGSGHNDGSPF